MNNLYNYAELVHLIKLSKKYSYNCVDLSDFASDFFFYCDEISTKNVNQFFSNYSELMHYFSVEACHDENFNQIIDDLIIISEERKFDDFDISYVINKKDILKIIEKYKDKEIVPKILVNQLEKKYFNGYSFDRITKILKERFNLTW